MQTRYRKRFFDYCDGFFQNIVSIVLGDIGIIVTMYDGGLVRNKFENSVGIFKKNKFTLPQFYELFARIQYDLIIGNFLFDYSFLGSALDNQIVSNKGFQYITFNNFRYEKVKDVSDEEFYSILKKHWKKINFDPNALLNTDLIVSTIFDENGISVFKKKRFIRIKKFFEKFKKTT